MDIIKEKIAMITVSAAAAAALAVYLFVFAPMAEKIGAASNELAVYDARIAEACVIIKEAKKMDTKRVFVTEKAFVTEERISAAIAELTEQKKLYDINFISITPGTPEKMDDPRFRALPIEIETESSYEKLGTFLGLLDNLEGGVVTIDSFKIKPSDAGPDTLNSELVLNLYISDKDGR
jgi:Tfp pilus assembly protein PilO